MSSSHDGVTLTNAYAILTNIQGFDSFQLGPNSTSEEITRAFQTQSLIWHPEKNPGDTQALQIYRRMQQAYQLWPRGIPTETAYTRLIAVALVPAG